MKTKRLVEVFGPLHLELKNARLMSQIWDNRDNKEKLKKLIEKVPDAERYSRQCYTDPYYSYQGRRSLALYALDVLLGTHGVEGIQNKDGKIVAEYLNSGDTYNVTLLYLIGSDRLQIDTWGDYVERHNL